MNEILEYLQGMESRINVRLDNIENRLTTVETNIENDIQKYCDTLADAHISTQRRLDELGGQIEENNRNYIVSRLNLLEREMREIQARLA